MQAQAWCPQGLVVLGARRNYVAADAVRLGAERWFGCLGLSPGLLLPPDSRTGLGRSLFGQDAGALQVGRRSPKKTPKSRTIPTRPFARGVAKLDCQFSKLERIAEEVGPREWLPVLRGLVALADHFGRRIVGSMTNIRKAGH
jgi:hypothetical protein